MVTDVVNTRFETEYLPPIYTTTTLCMLTPVESLLRSWVTPLTVLATTKADSPKRIVSNKFVSRSRLPKFFLDPHFDLQCLLSNSIWIDQDIQSLASKLKQADTSGIDDSHLGQAFYQKYGRLPHGDDTRFVAIDWSSDLRRALSHINPKAVSGRLLHIGSDNYFEPPIIHSKARSVILADISEKLLQRAVVASPSAESFHTKAEDLIGISSNSVDLIVALRVFCSTGFNPNMAVKQVSRVLRPEGSILLSVSNGYRATDNTILPGQVVGTPPRIDFSRPFEEALTMLGLLYDAGFRELFLLPGSTELFFGGTYLPGKVTFKGLDPILHIESVDHVPLCFYSALMPTAWLGNYSPHPVRIDGFVWPTVEHFFQAEKFQNLALRQLVRLSTSPQVAKSLAWSFSSEIRSDWSTARIDIMHRGLRAKFDQHPYLRSPLISTKSRELIERSSIDHFWGRSPCGEGTNMTGTLLMSLRAQYKKGASHEA